MPMRMMPAMMTATVAYWRAGSFSFRKMRERRMETIQYAAIMGAATAPLPLIAYT